MPEQLPQRTILVVEDSQDTRFVLRWGLEMCGFHVVEAANGQEAVEVALRERPDLILMDIGLPLLDGLAATRAIRETKELRGVPIMAVTAYYVQGFQNSALDAGCDDYVIKPIDLDRLRERINNLLARRAGENHKADHPSSDDGAKRL